MKIRYLQPFFAQSNAASHVLLLLFLLVLCHAQCTPKEALYRQEPTSTLQRWKECSSNIFIVTTSILVSKWQHAWGLSECTLFDHIWPKQKLLPKNVQKEHMLSELEVSTQCFNTQYFKQMHDLVWISFESNLEGFRGYHPN